MDEPSFHDQPIMREQTSRDCFSKHSGEKRWEKRSHKNDPPGVASSFDDELATKHAHLAGKLVLARLLWQKLHRNRLACRQPGALAEVVEEYHLRAGHRLLASEVKAHRFAVLHNDHIGRIATLDQDHR